MSEINSGHHYLPTYQIVMISDNVESFETMHIEVRLQSLNGQTDTTITEFTTNRVAGNIQPINSLKCQFSNNIDVHLRFRAGIMK
jgi:hypothetical protein